MIKTVSALSLALLLCACGGGNQATKSAGEPTPSDEAAAPAAETPLPATEGERAKMAAEPAPAGTTAPASDAAPMTEADWEQAVVFSEKLADVVDANQADCDKMAAGVKTLFDESEELIAKANAWQQTASEEDQQRFGELYKDRLAAMGAKLGPALQKCTSHQGVMEQFQRFQ